eukprot:581495-Prorocentrum_minimum.AAC.1
MPAAVISCSTASASAGMRARRCALMSVPYTTPSTRTSAARILFTRAFTRATPPCGEGQQGVERRSGGGREAYTMYLYTK